MAGVLRARSSELVLLVIAAALAAEVVLLALENRSLRAALAAEAEAEPAPPPRRERARLARGDVLGDFGVLDAAGARREVAFDGAHRRTLLVVLAERCPACADALPVLAPLVTAAAEAGARVVALQLDRRAPLDDPGLGVALAHPADLRELPAEELLAVPLVSVLDEAGIVLAAAYGRPAPSLLDELTGLLGRPPADGSR